MERTFAAERMNEAATKSAPTPTAHWRSWRSLAVRAGRVSVAPGKFTPLRALIGPLFRAAHHTV